MSPEELSQKAVKPGELAMNCRSLAHELALDSRIDRERLSGPAWRRRSIRLLHNRRTRGNERYPRPGGGARNCRDDVPPQRSQRPLANEVYDQRCNYAQYRQVHEGDHARHIWRPQRLGECNQSFTPVRQELATSQRVPREKACA